MPAKVSESIVILARHDVHVSDRMLKMFQEKCAFRQGNSKTCFITLKIYIHFKSKTATVTSLVPLTKTRMQLRSSKNEITNQSFTSISGFIYMATMNGHTSEKSNLFQTETLKMADDDPERVENLHDLVHGCSHRAGQSERWSCSN